jgi:diguanylate cyclase (GGDEF)-like protein
MVHVVRDLEDVANIDTQRVGWFVLVSLTGLLAASLAIGGLHFLRSRRQHQRELANQARTDALTGCANRRSFREAVEAERQRANRYGSPFSLLMIDLDHFKAVNDLYGHLGGDQVLCHFVSTVLAILRPSDLLGRIGGEEFAILMPQTTDRDAAAIAERIRTTVEAETVTFEEQAISVTVSIGVTQWRPEHDQTIDSLFGCCDKALYAAKNAGRNQVKESPGFSA